MASPTKEKQSQSVPVRTKLGEKMAKPKIIIVGGGFAGLAAAKALRKTPAKVDLIDRTNHHLFEPLPGTYQGLDEQVYLPKSPGSFVPRGSSNRSG